MNVFGDTRKVLFLAVLVPSDDSHQNPESMLAVAIAVLGHRSSAPASSAPEKRAADERTGAARRRVAHRRSAPLLSAPEQRAAEKPTGVARRAHTPENTYIRARTVQIEQNKSSHFFGFSNSSSS